MDKTRKEQLKHIAVSTIYMAACCVMSVMLLTYVSAPKNNADTFAEYEPHAGNVTGFIAYEADLFKKAQLDDIPIVVLITAKWCRTCTNQKKTIAEILPDPYFSDILFLRVDYDENHEDFLYFQHQYQVKTVSTLLAFKGERLLASSLGETDHVDIVELFMEPLE